MFLFSSFYPRLRLPSILMEWQIKKLDRSLRDCCSCFLDLTDWMSLNNLARAEGDRRMRASNLRRAILGKIRVRGGKHPLFPNIEFFSLGSLKTPYRQSDVWSQVTWRLNRKQLHEQFQQYVSQFLFGKVWFQLDQRIIALITIFWAFLSPIVSFSDRSFKCPKESAAWYLQGQWAN